MDHQWVCSAAHFFKTLCARARGTEVVTFKCIKQKATCREKRFCILAPRGGRVCEFWCSTKTFWFVVKDRRIWSLCTPVVFQVHSIVFLILSHDLRGHLNWLHRRLSFASPLHGWPPRLANNWMDRSRVWNPPLHVALQTDQSAQLLHLQSTGLSEISTWKLKTKTF